MCRLKVPRAYACRALVHAHTGDFKPRLGLPALLGNQNAGQRAYRYEYNPHRAGEIR
jgi:hypothetical protein